MPQTISGLFQQCFWFER